MPDALSQEQGASSSITVITSDDIAREKPVSIIEILRQKVGVDENGSQVNMRGVQGVVVVIDNVPVAAIPSSLKPEDVERIEIVRGAASSRYGASAMGGAVIITTKKGDRRWSLDVIQGYGSFDRYYTKVIGGGSRGDWSLRISGEESVIRKLYEAGPADTPFSYMVCVEDFYTKRRSIDTKIEVKGEAVESDLNLNYYESYNTFGRPNWRSEPKDFKLRWTLRYAPLSYLEFSSILYYDDFFFYDGVKDKGTGTDATGLTPDRKISSPSKTYSFEIQSIVNGGDSAHLTLGIKTGVDEGSTAIRDYYTENLRFDYKYKMGQEAAFLLLSIEPVKKVSIDISGRYDRYRYYDVYINDSKSKIYGEPLIKESFNPKIGFKWNSSEKLSVRGTISTGFIPPTPYNLYFKDISAPVNQIFNNPDLKPETSITADIGIDMALPYGLNIGITPFYTLWSDKVDRVYTVAETVSTQQPKNIGESISKGVELQINEKFNERWSGFFNYTFNHTEITKNEADKSVIGNKIPDMPENKFNIGLTYQKNNSFNIKAVWRYVGSRFLDQKNTVRDERGFLWKRDAYSVVDLTIIKQLKAKGAYIENLELSLSIDNLFDEHYGKWFFYKDPGRIIRGEIAVKF